MANDEAAYRRNIKIKEDQKGRLEHQNAVLRQNLARLKEARDRVYLRKYDYDDVSRDVKKTVNSKHDWKGRRYDKGKRLMTDIVDEDKKAVEAIDRALDALERDIANTQNQIIGNDTLIHNLVTTINSLWHELKTLTN